MLRRPRTTQLAGVAGTGGGGGATRAAPIQEVRPDQSRSRIREWRRRRVKGWDDNSGRERWRRRRSNPSHHAFLGEANGNSEEGPSEHRVDGERNKRVWRSYFYSSSIDADRVQKARAFSGSR